MRLAATMAVGFPDSPAFSHLGPDECCRWPKATAPVPGPAQPWPAQVCFTSD